MKWRIIFLFFILTTIFSSIAGMFWVKEIKYWLPTPVPKDFVFVPVGSVVELGDVVRSKKKTSLHFYNSDCACSRFNFTEYKRVALTYKDEYELFFIVEKSNNALTAQVEVFLEKNGIRIIEDENGEIAAACGVYATPQLVLLDENKKLYYRGNYNQSRYCTGPNASYARMAFDSLNMSLPSPNLGFNSTQAYGCQIRKTDK